MNDLLQMTAENRSRDDIVDRGLGALLGLAVGDAVGTTLEFAVRDAQSPVMDMIGGGPFDLLAGQWTDDTAMALALADSLIASGRLDERDVMDRFCRWWQAGEYSCTGACFDIGNATRRALQRYLETGDPIAGSDAPRSAGNGSLMRLAPVVLYAVAGDADEMRLEDLARRQSAVTHAARPCLDACAAFSRLLRLAIAGTTAAEIFAVMHTAPGGSAEIRGILEGAWRDKERDEIRSSEYVVDSLEAAIWCVAETSNFKDAVLTAANLADDADTTAAITGQLAGAIYGRRGIPDDWLNRLAWADRIEDMGLRLLAVRS